ncbi:MAG: hypothetical protein GXY33_02700 [Phycisphaerae bacterium]|nr:hypothetical protein [Phycisphaerae bacterium]
MRFDRLEMNPAKSPGVLDTATWDRRAAVRTFEALSGEYLERLGLAAKAGAGFPDDPRLIAYPGSVAAKDGRCVLLAGLADGQHVFVEFVPEGAATVLEDAIASVTLAGSARVVCHAATSATVHAYGRRVKPGKGPAALGATPRLGIGVRMTTACWPGIFAAMAKKGFAANPIQNSIRELNVMSTLLKAEPPEKNYACGFGTIECGYTGSSFEGLWLSGVLEAIKSPQALRYGADADHIQVKRGPEGMARAKRYLDCARYYTFYTLDMADVLDYGAANEPSEARAAALLAERIPDEKRRCEIVAYHREGRRIGGREYRPDEAALGRLIGKHWQSLHAIEELTAHIRSGKDGEAFDLELSIDEHPPEIAAFDCLTGDEELTFLCLEIRRRGLAVTHVAPNFGVEKGLDYRCPDGLEGFERRIRSQFRIAEEFGLLLDFHSGDDLSGGPRRVIQKATGGRHQFKISPMVQIIFAEVLQDFEPDLFAEWWADALAYARREAEGGAEFARACLDEYEQDPQRTALAKTKVFHHYSFAFVGRRDAEGRFIYRERFYDLSKGFYQAYTDRLTGYLGMLADELF